MKNIGFFPVTVFRNIEVACEHRSVLAQHVVELFETPHIKLSFDAFAIGILSRVEGPVWVPHFACNEIERLLCDPPIKWVAGSSICVNINARKQCIVVEHFFKMGYEPPIIRRVPVKPAADLIVHAAVRHFVQCQHSHVQRVFIPCPVMITKQKVNIHAGRELRRATKSAFARIEPAGNCTASHIEQSRVYRFGFRFSKCLSGEMFAEASGILYNFFATRSVCLCDCLHNAPESRPAVSIVWWKICSAKNGFSAGQQKYRHGPTPAAGHHLDSSHVNLIQIRTFFAIDFDVHKIVVHDLRDRRILE